MYKPIEHIQRNFKEERYETKVDNTYVSPNKLIKNQYRMEWLEKIRSPLIFRSLYYGFYKLAIKTNNSTPRLTASLSMAFTHLIQVFFLIDILRALKVIDVFEATWAKTDTTNLTLWYTKKGKEWLTIDYYKWNKELEF